MSIIFQLKFSLLIFSILIKVSFWNFFQKKNEHIPLLEIGENKVVGFGGVKAEEVNYYHADVVIMRNWRQYNFDYFIQIAQVVCAAFSFYVPFSEDMLASRLSITLAILITLTVFTKERPPVIEEIPPDNMVLPESRFFHE